MQGRGAHIRVWTVKICLPVILQMSLEHCSVHTSLGGSHIP